MSDEDIACLTHIIEEREPHRVLEWGSGNSTAYFSDILYPLLGYEGKWVSIEDNGHYVDYLQDKISHDFVTVFWVQDRADYVDCVKKHLKKYDLIIIDGISELREACMEAAMGMIADDGLILLHDSQRKEYVEWVRKYPNHVVLTKGELPDGPDNFIHRGFTAFYPTV